MANSIRIGNCSGFYGDRLAAAKEMIDGGPIDVLTGDYLAELTMTILYNQMQSRGENMGYVGTFLKQVKEIAQDCKAKNIRLLWWVKLGCNATLLKLTQHQIHPIARNLA